MYMMYVDESGDSGLVGSTSRYYILSGLVIHELRWRSNLDQLLQFRRSIRDTYKLPVNEEIHSARMITRPGHLVGIPKHHRLAIIREFADTIAQLPDARLINVIIDKQGKGAGYDVFETAWKVLIQRFENTMQAGNFPGGFLRYDPARGTSSPYEERGLLFPDNTDNLRLMRLVRKMGAYNPIPNTPQFGTGFRNRKLVSVVEDPCYRDSGSSLYVQCSDLCVFLLNQMLNPNAYMRKKSGQNYFLRLQPILCTVAAKNDPLGIVRI